MSAIAAVPAFFTSSIGKKIIVALTGIVLLGFLPAHLAGNLLIYLGPEAINTYAYTLHSQPAVVWAARLVLLISFVLHVLTTISLTRANRASAAPSRYAVDHTQIASKSSRLMIWSGLTILAFVFYHILHFTVGAANEYHESAHYLTTIQGNEAHNVYRMVIDGFRWLPASLFYIVAIVLLCSHLSHGFASVFQTLGLSTEKTKGPILLAGKAYAALILIGNLSIPISILLGIVSY